MTADSSQSQRSVGHQKAEELVAAAKSQANEIIAKAEKRHNEIVDEAKDGARTEGERI